MYSNVIMHHEDSSGIVERVCNQSLIINNYYNVATVPCIEVACPLMGGIIGGSTLCAWNLQEGAHDQVML